VNYADGIASCLICIYSSFGRQLDLIRAVIEREILHSDMATTLLRRNTVAVKIISLFVKNVGSNYLRRTLAPICYQIALAKDEQLEVDPLVLRNLVPDDKVEQVRLRNMETLRKRF
jgi:neurofibromin 1